MLAEKVDQNLIYSGIYTVTFLKLKVAGGLELADLYGPLQPKPF